MTERRSILVLGSEPWESPLLSKQHVASALSGVHQVTWVDPPFHLGYLLHGKTPRSLRFPPYHDLTPSGMRRLRSVEFPRSQRSDFARALSSAALRWRLEIARVDPDLAISFHPGYWRLGKELGVPLVYYSVDHQWDQEAEAKILEHADLVVAGTRVLYERYRTRTEALAYIPHGVDVSTFGSALPTPTDIAGLSRPRAGFVGVLDDRLDLGALAAMSDAIGAGSVVLVGPYTSGGFGAGLPSELANELTRMGNVHLLGRKRTGELAAYLAAFDVGLVPYDRRHPRVHFSLHKTLQYMAFGLPVVTTLDPDPEHCDMPGLFTGATSATFAAALPSALAAKSMSTAIRAFAASNSWQVRVQQLLGLIDDLRSAS